MQTSRRNLLLQLLCGSGLVGLRSLASGIPMAWLARPEHALAQAATRCDGIADDPQFLVLSASESGDPLNANVPGSYTDPRALHSADPSMARTTLTLGGRTYEAAKPWATLPPAVLARTTFFHHATLTNAHPNHPKVLTLMGQTRRQEMLPSIYARALAPCLGTVQSEPVAVGAANAAELLRYEGRTLARLRPRSLRRVLGGTDGPLTSLRALRDRDLDRMNALFKEHGTNVQRAALDRLALSQREARAVPEQLLDLLSSITSDDLNGQILAAATLVRMKVAPVVTVHIPFGGDNHTDQGFAREAQQTVSGVAAIATLMQKLGELGVAEQTSFAILNVFGRTLAARGTAGRDHNASHATSVLIGKRIRSGVVGGMELVGKDFSAHAIDSQSGLGAKQGDIALSATMGALGKTLGAALGIDREALDREILSGKVVRAAVT